MAPTLLSICAAALALVGNVSAMQFYLDETYDKTNFFDKWDFFVSDYNSPDYNDVDPTSGYVNYRSRHDATQLGLIKQLGDEMYIGVNSHDVTEFPGVGRDSVRIESKSLYNEGLMIARFSHLPKPVCGSWPAFWSFGDPWPKVGELDFYEGWNDGTINKPVIHTNHASVNGSCSLTNNGQTSLVTHANCDTYGGIWEHQGCTTETTHEDPYGSEDGGIYAVEWTDKAIKFYSWTWANRPANIDSDEPDTSTWGKPSVLIASPSCEVKNHFRNHRLVINITFCGKAAGNDGIWAQSCLAATKKRECSAYVAENPADFEDTYWQVKDIRHFGLTRSPVTSISSAVSTSTTLSAASSSSVEASISSSAALEESSSTTSSEPEASSTWSEASSTVSSSSAVEASLTPSAVSEESSSTVFSEPETSSTWSVASSSLPGEVSSTWTGDDSTSTYVSADESLASSTTSDVPSSSSLPFPSSVGTLSSSAGPSRIVSVFPSLPTFYPPPSQSHHYGNFSSTAPPYPVSSSSCVDAGPTTTYTTSTVYTTKISTVTSCPSYIPNCKDRVPQVVTEIVPVYTTVCPVEVSTRTVKHVRTITSCPPRVPSTACPYGSKTTETSYVTVTKVLELPLKPTGNDEWPGQGADEEDNDTGGDKETDSFKPPSIISTTTEYVFHTATAVPVVPPIYSPTSPKNITLPVHNGPSHGDTTYPLPGHEVEAMAAPRSIGVGLMVAFGGAVAIFAM